MKNSRRILMTGIVLIVLTNAVALGGAAFNRSGEPESTLALSERELQLPYGAWSGSENSGLSLRLSWRTLQEAAPNEAFPRYFGGRGGSPAWLNAGKMAALGFDPDLSAGRVGLPGESRHQHRLPREVLVVLELDGPAYHQSVERSVQAAQAIEAKNERGEGRKNADAMIEREAHEYSRLFAVDAGLDRDALRQEFPDRTRYAIVRGTIRPVWTRDSQAVSGVLEGLNVETVNVPLEMRPIFEGAGSRGRRLGNDKAGRFDATLAFGQRLEPWLVSAVKK